MANQTVDLGTELSELNLPDTVTASVYHVTEDMVIPDEDSSDEDSTEETDDPTTASPSDAENSVSEGNAGDSSVKDSGKVVTTITTSKKEIPVTWDSEPAFDGDTEGTYVFTADVGGYALSDGAKLPKITVTVGTELAEKPTESQPGETRPCTQTEGCTLLNGHEGDCVPAPPSNDGLVQTITGWTFVATDYSDYLGNEFAIPSVSMKQQADFDTVVSMLPTQISAEIESEAEPIAVDIIGWSCPEYVRDSEGNWPLTGEYTFTAALRSGYACDPLPTVKVMMGGANTYSANTTIKKDGLTVAASNNGEVEYTSGSGFTLKKSGTYKISGTWNGTLNNLISENKKAVITVPADVTADVTLTGVEINMGGKDHACAFAVAVSGTANITLSGTNTLISGHSRAGLEVPENATVIIDGGGSLIATGGSAASGIGGSNGVEAYYYQPNAGNITICGGTVEANGSIYGAGIGSGSNGGNAGTIEINGDTVVFATASGNGAHIGGGENGSGQGSFTKGVVFEGEQGTVHGSPTLPGDVTIPSGSILTVPDGSTLMIPDGITLTNSGTIENNGTISGVGTLENNGTVNDHRGGISVTVNDKGTVNKPSEVEITFMDSQNGQITQAIYGDTIKITATAQQKATNTLARGAALNKVDFYIGTIALEHHIGTADVATDNGTATAILEITLTDETWKKGFAIGENTIVADFGDMDTLKLLGRAGAANLTVEMELSDAAAKITAPATSGKPEMTATVDNNANYTVQNVTWIGALTADGSFDYNTAYTVEITLNAKQYYRFSGPVTGTINGQTASVNRKSDTEAVLFYTFDKTASKPTRPAWPLTRQR